MGSLNPREQRFALEYVIDLNATQAAIRAGYSAKTAYAKGSQLFRKIEVREQIDSLISSMMEAKVMTATETLVELSKIGRASLRKMTHITPDGDPYTDLGAADSDDLDAVAEMSIEDFTDGREVDDEGKTIKRDVRRVKIKMHNKIAALGLLAKYHGLLIDKSEVTVSGNFADVMAAAMARAKGEGNGEDGSGA